MPMALGPYPHLMFGEEDQRSFAGSFKTELGRLGILRVAGPSDTTDLKIDVVFTHTEHKYNLNDYILDVDVLFTAGGKEEKKSYHVVSSEGDEGGRGHGETMDKCVLSGEKSGPSRRRSRAGSEK